MEDVTKEFDDEWKRESVRIAVQEQIYAVGVNELDIEALFKRAKIIYTTGYSKNIHTWHEVAESLVKTKQANQPKTQVNQPKTQVNKKVTKQCPSCKEQIPTTWNKHAYKENGERCGHTF